MGVPFYTPLVVFASLLLHIFTIWFYQSISSVSFSQCYILMLNNYSTARFLRANDTCNNSLTSTIAMLITLYPTINHWISNWIVIIVYRCINSSYLFNKLRDMCWNTGIWNLFQIGEESDRNCAVSPFTQLSLQS